MGIQRSLVQRYADGRTHLFVHQAKYAKFTVEAYEARFTGGRPLATISTPCDPSEAKYPSAPSARVPQIGAAAAARRVRTRRQRGDGLLNRELRRTKRNER